MGGLKKSFKSLDAFGAPVSLNYSGDSNFKTMAGAVITIVIKCFMLVYSVTQCLIVYNYEDPIVSQVRKKLYCLSSSVNFLYFFDSTLSTATLLRLSVCGRRVHLLPS